MNVIEKFTVLIFMFCALVSALSGQVRIVLSAALTNAHFEFRKQQYIESFDTLRALGYEDFYVVEALKHPGPTFVDKYAPHVFYSTANSTRYRNNGINEAKTMLEGVKHYNFDPDDIVLKLTGRYHFTSDQFIKLIEQNPEYDAFVKIDQWHNVFTLCFAMKNKYFIDMFEHIDYESCEQHWINIEHVVGIYVKQMKERGLKVYYINTLGVTGNLFGSSTAPGTPAETRFW